MPETESVLRDHVLERLHDLRRLGLLVVGEDAGHHDHCGQHDAQVKVVVGRLLDSCGLMIEIEAIESLGGAGVPLNMNRIKGCMGAKE